MLFEDPPLKSPPLIQGVCLVRPTRRETMSEIGRLERPPPNIYPLSNDLFTAIVSGRKDWDWAAGQARSSTDVEQRRHAIAILNAAKTFLTTRTWSGGRPFGKLDWVAGPSFALGIKVRWVVELDGVETALLYHFWQTALTDEQMNLSLAAARYRVVDLPGCAGMEVAIVTAPLDEMSGRRRFKLISSSGRKLYEREEIAAFGDKLHTLWRTYHTEHPERSWRR